MAKEALKNDVRGNMHMNSRLIKAAGFESEVSPIRKDVSNVP